MAVNGAEIVRKEKSSEWKAILSKEHTASAAVEAALSRFVAGGIQHNEITLFIGGFRPAFKRIERAFEVIEFSTRGFFCPGDATVGLRNGFA